MTAFQLNFEQANSFGQANAEPTIDFSRLNAQGFFDELQALRREIDEKLGNDDIAHLKKMERWGRSFTAVGLLSAGFAPNPVSMVCLALGRGNRWTLMHHIGHKGYDRVPGIPEKYTSKVFARGKRRFLDWSDWLIPEAWVYEHNVLHHAYTAEIKDPDLIEHNTELLRKLPMPNMLRFASLGILATIWRPGFYAPMALKVFKEKRHKEESLGDYSAHSIVAAFLNKDYWVTGFLPYAAKEFVLLPLAYLPLGPWAVFSAFTNSVGAEIVTSIHSFLVVLPNHCGDDLYRYDERPASRAERKIRQIVSSANYETGSDWQGFSQLWLNYQIEHHIWPDIPMFRYREVQPKVKALCEKYGVPYVQESLSKRLLKMVDVVVGKTSMKRVKTLIKNSD